MSTYKDGDEDLNPAAKLHQDEVDFSSRFRKNDESDSDVDSTVTEDIDDSDKPNWNYNADDPVGKDRERLNSREQAGDDIPDNELGKGDRLNGKLNGKRWAPGGLIGLLIFGIGAGSALVIPSSLLVMMERVFTNNGTHDVRANSTMGRARIGAVFSPVREAVCNTKITCKVTSMSQTEIDRWKTQPGVTIEEGKSVFGRKIVTAMKVELPEGGTLDIKNSSDFNKAMANNEHFRNLNLKVANTKASYFIGPDSKFRSILKKYKLTMDSPFGKAKTGVTEEERRAAYNAEADKASGIPEEGDSKSKIKARVEKVKEKATAAHERFKSSVAKKAGGAIGDGAGWVSMACTLYTVQKATLTTIKLSYYMDLIKVALPFAKAAGQVINGEDMDPELSAYINDRLTWYQSEATAKTPEQKAKVGLTATDSQGFQAALYGDYSKLKDFTMHYVPWYALSAASASGMVKDLETFAGGKQNIHNVCYGAKWASYLGLANPVGAGVTGICLAVDWGFDGACSSTIMKGFQWIIDQGMDGVYERLEQAALDADNLKGVDLGNAIAAGIGLFLMEKGRSSGLKPATSIAAVSAYLAATDQTYQQDLLAEKEDAKLNPFSTDNPSSFLSSVVTALTPYKSTSTTGLSIATNYMAVLSNTLRLNTDTTHAGYFQPIESVDRAESLQSMTAQGNADGSGRKCSDQDMVDAGFLCDMYGRSIDVVDPTPLKWADLMKQGDMSPWLDTVNYMQTNKYIEADGSGKPVDYDSYNSSPDPESYTEDYYKNDYLMWKAYCTNDRVYPLGTTMKSIDDDHAGAEEMGWYTGAKCSGNNSQGQHISANFDEELNRFFYYYNTCEVQLAAADNNQKCWEDQPVAQPTSATPSSQPTTKSGTIALDPGHSTMDITDRDATTGAILSDYPNGKEVTDAWDVANRVKAKLEQEGYTVKMLRNSISEKVNFQERADRAKGSVLAVSIHTTNVGGSQVGAQTVGGYRTANGKTLTFQNSETAAASQKYADAMAKGRNEKEGGGVSVRGFNFDGRGGDIASGNMPWVQLLSQDTPWIYNEMQPADGGGGSFGISEASKAKYVDGIVAGIEAAGIPKTSASDSQTQGQAAPPAANTPVGFNAHHTILDDFFALLTSKNTSSSTTTSAQQSYVLTPSYTRDSISLTNKKAFTNGLG